MLDFVSADYDDLKSRLGSDDKAKLDQHLTNVRDIETRVARLMSNPTSASCPGVQDVIRCRRSGRSACVTRICATPP